MKKIACRTRTNLNLGPCIVCFSHRRAETEGIRRKAFNSASNWFCYPEPRRPTETGRDRLTRAFSLAVIPMDLHLRICPSRGPFKVHLDDYWPRGPLLTMAVLGPTGQQKVHLDENKPLDPCHAMAVIGTGLHPVPATGFVTPNHAGPQKQAGIASRERFLWQ